MDSKSELKKSNHQDENPKSELVVSFRGNTFKGPQKGVIIVFAIACVTLLIALFIMAWFGMTTEAIKAFGSW
jgi:hypothetical protein